MNTQSAIAINDGTTDVASRGARALSGATAQPRIVTTSWDDGDPFDLEIATLLAECRIPGTFYIPVRGHHRSERMDRTAMLSLDSQGFEIGAHGVSHPNLPHCDREQLAGEVETCKRRLEEDLHKEVSMFAYPNGRHNANVIASVKRAGFTGARTTAMLARELTFDPFRMPTSLQAFPHSKLDYLKNLFTGGDFRRTWGYLSRLPRAPNWVTLAMLLFDMVLNNGGVWHLYGHSWEINDLRLLEELRVVLDYVANRPGVLYLPNGAVLGFRTAQSLRKAVSVRQPAL